jgi:antitoxin component of MazEF toxin-antitoxin module
MTARAKRTAPAKRKVSVTLDADLVAALEAEGGTTVSAEVNSALRAAFTRRKRQQALADLLEHLAEERGRLDTPEDEAEIARYMRLLGGVADEAGGLRAG